MEVATIAVDTNRPSQSVKVHKASGPSSIVAHSLDSGAKPAEPLRMSNTTYYI